MKMCRQYTASSSLYAEDSVVLEPEKQENDL